MKNKTEIIERLRENYADTSTALEFENPYELLVATILAAQCTDARVNMVTPALFARYPSPAELALADIAELEAQIKSCGFFHSKAKNLIACAARIVSEYGGQVPREEAQLTSLAGVGKKTAGVVQAFAFGIPAFPVDTHVGRVARRLGFTTETDPDKVTEALKKAFKKSDWCDAHHWMIWHGRLVCKSQRPLCEQCKLQDLCPYFKQGQTK